MEKYLENIKVFVMSKDPVYIGTGGFTIGRVDNTIIRDPSTKIPKIPGSSISGTWRSFMSICLNSYFKEECQDLEERRKFIHENESNKLKVFLDNTPNKWVRQEKNIFSKLKCAGQDEPNENFSSENSKGHCGKCIVCKSFGFSKNDKSNQGQVFISDMNILFFPVPSRFGVKWVTSPRLLNDALNIKIIDEISNETAKSFEANNNSSINLGWINLKLTGLKNNLTAEEKTKTNETLNNKIIKTLNNKIDIKDIIIVSDTIISQIINSNLEVRTSVSIDPLTGAAKDKALFTSEAIPRGTIFYSELRIFKRSTNDFEISQIKNALIESKILFESLGVGGMTTRGFGRIELFFNNPEN
jgi:CRISPR-associated protein Cmr4